MISRRNIRVKVMQLIYALESMDETGTPIGGKNDPVKTLSKQLDQSRELFVYLLHFLMEVTRYAETDAKQRASRHLLTAEDLNVNTKLAGNELLWKVLESESYKKSVAADGPGNIEGTTEWIRKIYLQLLETGKYQSYIAVQGREKATEKDIIQFIFTELMLVNEDFHVFIEENFSNWDDDAEMMLQLVNNYLQKPASYNLHEMVGTEKWQFARSLLVTTLEKKDHLLEIIKPRLKNWDADRIAVLDMILMEMGVAEFLYFETIPPKVTINEYIDIAKDYSTPQSGQFVNGILDGIHKELLAQDKIHKTDFKQKA